MKCGFPGWPTWQIYFVVSVTLIRAYMVSILYHSWSKTIPRHFEKIVVSSSKKQRVHKFLHLDFWTVLWVKMKLIESWTGIQCIEVLLEFNHRFQIVLARKFESRILDQGSMFYWSHLTRIVYCERERWTDRAVQQWKSPIGVQETGFNRLLVDKAKGISVYLWQNSEIFLGVQHYLPLWMYVFCDDLCKKEI
jgi:hypothetical protein